jgi:hypothetical protein
MKVSLVLLAFLFLTVSLVAQDVPASVEKAFDKRFAKVESVIWESNEDGSYVALFLMDGADMSAQYNAEGGLLSTTTYIDEIDIPAKVQKVVAKKFPDYEMYDISRVETPVGTYFEVMLESDSDALMLQVKGDGTILKKEAVAIDIE